MRLILIVIAFIPFIAFSQKEGRADDNMNVACKVGESRDQPLYIVNGVPVEMADIKLLDPDQIESIHILKTDPASIIGCYRSDRNIIIVQLKRQARMLLNIRSQHDGMPVDQAVVILKKKGTVTRDIIRYSDSLGHVDLSGLDDMMEYEVSVEGFTFQSYKETIRLVPGTKAIIELKQKMLVLQEVVVSGELIFTCRVRRTVCGGFTNDSVAVLAKENILSGSPAFASSVSLYPNPVAGGRDLWLAIHPQKDIQAMIEVHSLSGQVMLQQTSALKAGYQKINIPVNEAWAKGVYLLSAKTKRDLLAREKFIVE